MKIYLGHPKEQESESEELRLKGLKYNKAAPSAIPLVGLYQVYQPGYGAYTKNLPAFIFANESQTRVKLNQVGYPINCRDTFPLPMPLISIKVKNPSKEVRAILGTYDTKEVKDKKTTSSTFTITPAERVYGALRVIPAEKHFPPAGQVDLAGYARLAIVLRIFSGFLRVATYPAFSTPEDGDDVSIGIKRRLIEVESGSVKRSRGNDGKATVSVNDGEDEAMAGTPTSPEEDPITFSFAKPQDLTKIAWGNSFEDIPETHGIVFPYEPALAAWDKDTVPGVIERHFIRSLGSTDKGILDSYTELCVDWKRCVYNTTAGMILSHIGKLIEIAIPAQARVFCCFENGQYKGAYLAGACYSLGLRGAIYRPEPYEENSEALSQLFSAAKFRDTIIGLTPNNLRGEAEGKFGSLRELHNFMMARMNLSLVKRDEAKQAAAQSGFSTIFWPPTCENIRKAISYALVEKKIPTDLPLHHVAFLENDPLTSVFSAFGPLVPSPHIPGGSEVRDFSKVPNQSSCCFRRCGLVSAVQEWKEFLDKGIARNEPKNLNARFQYAQMKGQEAKKEWYALMDWAKSLKKPSETGDEYGVDADDGEGGVYLARRDDAGIDILSDL